MVRRLLLNLSSLILIILLLLAGTWPMVASTYASDQYPPMAPGQNTGSVTGRVTTNASVAMPGVTVYIVNASDSTIRYISSITDNDGYFTFAGVNSTNGAAVYRIFGAASGYDNATSSAFSVSSGTTATAYVMLTRNYSIATPTPVPPAGPGDIVGYITVENTTKGIINARVSLVTARVPDVTIVSVITDSNGRYRFSGVDYLAAPGYRLRIQKNGYDETFSAPFLIVSGSTVTKDISLSPSVTANATQSGSATPLPGTPTPNTSASATPHANPGLPGFGIATALAGVTLAYALAKKK
jgi:hypothetical protein